LNALFEQRKLLQAKTLIDAVSLLGDVCLHYSESVDDSFRKVTKKDITDLIERLEELLVYAFKAND
jgi:hypothetical protein